MTAPEKRKGGGGKLARTETVTVRLDPQLRYFIELAARKHSRTVSSYIEWKLKSSLDTEDVRPVFTPAHIAAPETLGTEAEYLWDVDEADRFAKLALRYPQLLTHEEQVRWKLIRDNGSLWKGKFSGGYDSEWTWTVGEQSLIFERLREHWTAFCAVAATGTGRETLPTWKKVQPAVRPPPKSSISASLDAMDDDIPF